MGFDIESLQKEASECFDLVADIKRVLTAARRNKYHTQPKYAVQLLKKLGKPTEEIKTVLNWYKENHNKKYVPQIVSVRNFFFKYDALVAAMERDGERPQQVIPSLLAKRLSHIIQAGVSCPTQLVRKLPELVQVSLVNLRNFRATAADWKLSQKERVSLGADYLLKILEDTESVITTHWLQAVRSTVIQNNLNKSFNEMTLSVENKHFQQLVKEVLNDYHGDQWGWAAYQELLSKAPDFDSPA